MSAKTNDRNQNSSTTLYLAAFGAVLAAALLLFITTQSHSESRTQIATQLEDTLLERQVDTLFALLIQRNEDPKPKLDYIYDNWHEGMTPMIIELLPLNTNAYTFRELLLLLEDKTSQNFGSNINGWFEWLWRQEYEDHPYYPEFKAALYGLLDERFREYFYSDAPIKIRLDEVRWGGVKQDGIPPLRNPKMITAKQAEYLQDDNIVFGIAVNGDARAYPKRILAWHEMFTDKVGGEPVAGVYCTLCGSMILYETQQDDKNYQLGTSGFLYRSNKLMYDKATQSLWNTIWGKPVIGKLADQNIKLKRLSVVTTTWGDWKQQHPNTTVLSLDTGHSRDYGEGVAYKDYFGTDELMFGVPNLDTRLANKAEVVALLPETERYDPLAISTTYLLQNPVINESLGKQAFVALTNSSGAVRVYERGDALFDNWNGRDQATEKDGTQWQVHEDFLQASNGKKLKRLPSHRAFWFGWHSAYPDTRLIK